MSDKKQINMNISDGMEFFAHELSINFNPMQFMLDFKCITPRNDVRSKENPFLSMKHNLVLVDPYHAKKIHELLGATLARYEEQFGKIDVPKAVKKWKKDNKKKQKGKKASTKTSVPSYLG